MARSLQLQSRPESRIHLSSDASQAGHEAPTTRLCIDISNYELMSDRETGGLEVLQVYLTVPQFAALVVEFFRETCSPRNIYTNLLQRLLKHRWAVMTHPISKETWLGRSGPSMPRYDDLGAPSRVIADAVGKRAALSRLSTQPWMVPDRTGGGGRSSVRFGIPIPDRTKG